MSMVWPTHIFSSANLTRISKVNIPNLNTNFEVRLTSLPWSLTFNPWRAIVMTNTHTGSSKAEWKQMDRHNQFYNLPC